MLRKTAHASSVTPERQKGGDPAQGDTRRQNSEKRKPSGSSSTHSGHARSSSFAGHYGQLLIAEGIAPIPKALFLYQGALGLSPQQVWFISSVLAHKWSGDLPHPSLSEIARHATLGLRQVKKIKGSLVEMGLLETAPRYGTEGAQGSNSYDFGPLFSRLEMVLLNLPDNEPKDELAGEDDVYDANYIEAPLRPEKSAREEQELSTETLYAEGIDYSFAARFGRIILRRGVAAVPRAIFTCQADLNLSPQQLWFICYILSFQWSTELPYPSLRKMARNTGYSERQIHRIKDSLIDAGYLRVIERHGADGRDTTSAYDFTKLLGAASDLIRSYPGTARDNGFAPAEQSTHDEQGDRYPTDPLEANVQASPKRGGELCVSGRVNSASGRGERGVSGGVNPVSAGGVNPVSVEGVNCTSYKIESVQKESDKEESHQQQKPAENKASVKEQREQDEENAFYALADIGVLPSVASSLAQQQDPDLIHEWVRHYLLVLSKQPNLTNPLGLLVKKLRAGEDPPYVPSQGDLQSMRIQMSLYR